MSQPIITVVGSLNRDLVLKVERHPETGETVYADDSGTFLGGKGFNQAIAAARAGAEVHLIGMVGQDEAGDLFLDALQREGIEHGGVGRHPAGTGMAIPIIDRDGANLIVVVPRANFALTPADVRRQAETIRASQVLILQLETTFEASIEAATIAREAGIPVIMNAAPVPNRPDGETRKPFVRLVKELSDIVIVNQQEASDFTGQDVWNSWDRIELAAKLLRLEGPPTAIITLSSRGAYLDDDGNEVRIKPYQVDAVDSTGAGDAFIGAFSTRIALGDTAEAAARIGNVAGALACQTMGAEPSMPTRQQVESFLASPPRQVGQNEPR